MDVAIDIVIFECNYPELLIITIFPSRGSFVAYLQTDNFVFWGLEREVPGILRSKRQ